MEKLEIQDLITAWWQIYKRFLKDQSFFTGNTNLGELSEGLRQSWKLF